MVHWLHQKGIWSSLSHKEFNSLWLRHLQIPFRWRTGTTFGTTTIQLHYCCNSMLYSCVTNSGTSCCHRSWNLRCLTHKEFNLYGLGTLDSSSGDVQVPLFSQKRCMAWIPPSMLDSSPTQQSWLDTLGDELYPALYDVNWVKSGALVKCNKSSSSSERPVHGARWWGASHPVSKFCNGLVELLTSTSKL
jgi:hypothetical protein